MKTQGTIIRNDAYNLVIEYTDARGKEWALVGRRVTSRGGAVFDGDGKCLQHIFTFCGWELRLNAVCRTSGSNEYGDRVVVEEYKPAHWVDKTGKPIHTRKFNSKQHMMDTIGRTIEF